MKQCSKKCFGMLWSKSFLKKNTDKVLLKQSKTTWLLSASAWTQDFSFSWITQRQTHDEDEEDDDQSSRESSEEVNFWVIKHQHWNRLCRDTSEINAL